MRIVSGLFRGRRLAAPRGRDVRPTADRVREALFSILGDIEGEDVLDVFAGTGALGLEALSRGARAAVFVEVDRQACEIVRRNIDATVTGDRSHVELFKGDAQRVLQSLALAERRFDLVFFDPPYEQTAQLVEAVAESLPMVCATGARVVLELATRHRDVVARAVDAWGGELLTDRTYGDTVVAIIAVRPRAAADPIAASLDVQAREDDDDVQ